jgi:hypothetical protein
MRSPVAWLSACSCALALAGCGGEERRTEPSPTLPAALAERLARDADIVAVRLEAGDPCGAASAAERLRRQAIAAVNGPAVPSALEEELLSNVQSLFDRTARACSAAATPAPPAAADVEEADEDEDGDRGGNGRGKGKGKREGRGHGGDD